MKKMLCTIIYIIGICCVCYYGFVFLSHNQTIKNPEAMLPFTEYESAFCMLGFGAIPMVASCFSMCWAYSLKHTKHKKRNIFLIFIPAIPCTICFMFIGVLILIMLVEGWFNAIGWL